MTEPAEKTPAEQAVDQAMDLFVYAPIGLLFEGASILPQLVEKGRSQVTMAKMIGKLAVRQGRSGAAKAAGKLQDQAAGVLSIVGDSVVPVTAPAPAPRPAAAPEARPSRPATATVEPAAPVADLAIPDYDGLSASQVVARLGGLSAPELDAVRRYEAAKRGRKTILSKVAQLQAG